MRYQSSNVTLLSSGFSYPSRRLFFSRARLYLDHIELSGWNVGQKHRQEIPLHCITRVEWNESASDAPNVIVHLRDGEPIRLILQDVQRWKRTLETHLQRSRPRPSTAASSGPSTDLPLQDLVRYTSSMG